MDGVRGRVLVRRARGPILLWDLAVVGRLRGMDNVKVQEGVRLNKVRGLFDCEIDCIERYGEPDNAIVLTIKLPIGVHCTVNDSLPSVRRSFPRSTHRNP